MIRPTCANMPEKSCANRTARRAIVPDVGKYPRPDSFAAATEGNRIGRRGTCYTQYVYRIRPAEIAPTTLTECHRM